MGLAVKPIIDIDIVIDDNFDEVKSLLEEIGYCHEGDLGIPGRDAFKYEGKPHLMMHHLYVCKRDNEELQRHITFRNYLREHPDVRDRYGAVKEFYYRRDLSDVRFDSVNLCCCGFLDARAYVEFV